MQHGIDALLAAQRRYGRALRCLMPLLPDGPAQLPRRYALHHTHADWIRHEVGRRRVDEWFAVRRSIDDREHARWLVNLAPMGDAWTDAESAAREAEQLAVDAYNWLDDAGIDLGSDTQVDVASFIGRPTGPIALGALIERAHELAHAAGELVGGIFGCRYTNDGDGWYEQCVVSLMHVRLGNSAGFTCRYVCTICGAGAGECDHVPGTEYDVIVGVDADRACSVCGESSCGEHAAGSTAKAVADFAMKDAILHEVSLTPRPRDPLARITARSKDDSVFVSELGRVPDADEQVLAHGCMYPCGGMSASSLD